MTFNAAGTKLYTPNFGDKKIYTFDVSSPFDLKNTTSSSVFTTNASGPTAILFNNDGSKVYILDTQAGSIKSASLTTPYDLSTGNLSALVSEYTIAHGGWNTGMDWNGDGTKLLISEEHTETLHYYSLSTPYGISSITGAAIASIDLKSAAGVADGESPKAVAFNSDGTKLYVASYNGGTGKFYQADLSTAYDISTATWQGSVAGGGQLHGLISTSSDTVLNVLNITGRVNIYTISNGGNIVPVADTTAPTISSVSLNAANDELTVTFAEDVYNTNGGSGDLEASDFAFSISGGTATVTATPSSITKTSQSVWVLGVSLSGTPDGNETLSVVPSGAAAIYDAAGNAASTTQSNNTASLTEKVAPTMAITAAEVSDGDTSSDGTLSLTFTSSEATSNFAVGDITVTNGSISNFASTSSTVYTATFTPTAAGATTIDVAGGAFTDAAGNNNTAATQFNWTYDVTGPTMTITAAEVSDGDTSADTSLSLTFTASEATSNFAVGDITVTNGSISNFASTSSTVYTATFTPTAAGATTIDVAGGAFTDASGNNNAAAAQFNWTYSTDTAPPSASSITVDGAGTTVTIGMGETLAASTPSASAFTVTEDGTGKTPTAVTISGSDVELTMGSAVEAGSIVTVAYTKPTSGNVLEDTAGNEVASFDTSGSITATNNSTSQSDPTQKADVVGSLLSKDQIAYQFHKSSIDAVNDRLSWLATRWGNSDNSKQGIRFKFTDPVLNQFVNSSAKRFRDYGETDLATLASKLGSTPELYEDVLMAQAVSLGLAELKAKTGGVDLNPEFGSASNGWSFWSHGELSVGKTSASTSAASRDFNRTVLTFGLDKEYKQDSLIGFAALVGREDTDVGADGSNVQSDNFGVTVYTAYRLEGLPQVETSLNYASLSFDTKRIDGSETLTGERSGHVYSGSVRARQFVKYAGLDNSYYAGLNLADIKLESFDETGGNRALRYFDQDIDYQELDFGGEISKTNGWKGFKIRTYSKLQYSSFLNKSFPASMRYLNGSNIYNMNVSTELKTSGTLKLGVNVWKSDVLNVDFAASRTESIHSNDNDHHVNSINIGLRFRF